MASEVRIASEGELPIGELREIRLSGDLVVGVARLSHGKVAAFEPLCPHQGAPLVDGHLDGVELSCPAHRWRFNVETGAGIFPRACKLKSYLTSVRDGEVFITLAEDGSPEAARPTAQTVG